MNHKVKKRGVLFAVALGLTALPLTACGSSGHDSAKGDNGGSSGAKFDLSKLQGCDIFAPNTPKDSHGKDMGFSADDGTSDKARDKDMISPGGGTGEFYCQWWQVDQSTKEPTLNGDVVQVHVSGTIYNSHEVDEHTAKFTASDSDWKLNTEDTSKDDHSYWTAWDKDLGSFGKDPVSLECTVSAPTEAASKAQQEQCDDLAATLDKKLAMSTSMDDLTPFISSGYGS